MTLLHACCGPCASACVPALREDGRKAVLLFANSNIDTREEWEKRLAAARTLAAAEGVPLEAVPYDHADWLKKVARGYENEPEKGARCARCWRYSLRQAAAYAAAHGFEDFTTSLTVSPHKPSEAVFAAGRDAAAAVPGAVFLEKNFKKQDGFLRSVRRTKELGLYRQDWCGCEFSKRAAAHDGHAGGGGHAGRVTVPGAAT